MAKFICVEGLQGEGKSLYASRIAHTLHKRNKKLHEELGLPIRKIASNIKWSPAFEAELGEYSIYWRDCAELVQLRNVDIIWDEIANDLDARNFAMLSSEFKRFLSRLRKRGIDVYANTQDFDMVDKRARTMIRQVLRARKIIGSGDPNPTRPEVKHPWGVIWMREFENYRDGSAVSDYGKRKYSWFPAEVFFVRRRDIDAYDTTEDLVSGSYPPLEHQERECIMKNDPDHPCGFKKTFHL